MSFYSGGKEAMGKTSKYYLLKLNRVFVWVCFFLLIIFVLSGYGIANPELVEALTGGIVTRMSAIYLHRILDMPLLALLMTHILIELKFALARWGVKDGKLLNVFLIILGGFFVGLLILMNTVRY